MAGSLQIVNKTKNFNVLIQDLKIAKGDARHVVRSNLEKMLPPEETSERAAWEGERPSGENRLVVWSGTLTYKTSLGFTINFDTGSGGCVNIPEFVNNSWDKPEQRKVCALVESSDNENYTIIVQELLDGKVL